MIPPLSAEGIPGEARELRDELSGMLPFVPIASPLIELGARTNLIACFTHAGGHKTKQTLALKRNILAVLIAGATKPSRSSPPPATATSPSTRSWRTRPICRSPSTPPTPTAPPW
ncbi:hypothetical protein [Nonomuraea longicatena]|uniref:Uncharacterized protein n=1 Tax=Nonomuraea longicatena TaxID=83682 RepID=A0ABN1Q5D0_9ACTN